MTELSDPFENVQVRPGSASQRRRDGKYPSGTRAMVLHYIDARQVMERLDACVVSWEDTYALFGTDGAVQCHLSICESFGSDGTTIYVTKSGVGYPNGENDPEPSKSAESDALKRAAVKFGVGRFLYDLPKEWRDVDEYGRFTETPSVLANKAREAVGAPARQETPSAPSQGVSEGSQFDFQEPSVPSGATNKYGDPIPEGLVCPDHGTDYMSVRKANGDPYLSRQKAHIGHCMFTLDKGKKPWLGGKCWGEYLLSAIGE